MNSTRMDAVIYFCQHNDCYMFAYHDLHSSFAITLYLGMCSFFEHSNGRPLNLNVDMM